LPKQHVLLVSERKNEAKQLSVSVINISCWRWWTNSDAL